jgi:tRNA-specific 2-thiouridylase
MIKFLSSGRILQRSIERMKHTVAVAMSGGIDSSVSALLLKEKGYNCVGVFMKNWDFSDEVGEYKCSYTEDRKDVEDVCKHLEIPLVEVWFRLTHYLAFIVRLFHYLSLGRFLPRVLE